MTDNELTDSTTIDAAPAAVAAAIGGARGLAVWLADEAWTGKRPDGRVALWWNDGRQAFGRWTEYAPPERLALRVRFDDRPGWARMAFRLRPSGSATTLEASLVVETPADLAPWTALWRHVLADVRTWCESGRNGRYLRRPMLGVGLDEVDAAAAAAMGLPISGGIRITNVVADSGADRAGIRQGDVMVALGGRPLTDWPSVGAALDHNVAGDTVPVRLWRDGQALTLEVTLGSRDEPAGPAGTDAIRTTLAENRARLARRLRETLAGVSEAQADHHPAPGEWSVKESLAHLSDSERWFADDTARLAANEPALAWAPGTTAVRARGLSGLALEHLARRLEADLHEAEAQAAMLLGEKPSPALLAHLGEACTWSPEHFEEHLAQIAAAVAAAREAGVA